LTFYDEDGVMRSRMILSTAILGALLMLGTYPASAQVPPNPNTTAQELGARTRGEIARLSIHSVGVDRMLQLQSDGDRALRADDPVRAAEYYGQVEEGVIVLNRQRLDAINARDIARVRLERARKSDPNLIAAEDFDQKGDEALDNGDYTEARIYYGLARADISMPANVSSRY
jgi:hypothetical protein